MPEKDTLLQLPLWWWCPWLGACVAALKFNNNNNNNNNTDNNSSINNGLIMVIMSNVSVTVALYGDELY